MKYVKTHSCKQKKIDEVNEQINRKCKAKMSRKFKIEQNVKLNKRSKYEVYLLNSPIAAE